MHREDGHRLLLPGQLEQPPDIVGVRLDVAQAVPHQLGAAGGAGSRQQQRQVRMHRHRGVARGEQHVAVRAEHFRIAERLRHRLRRPQIGGLVHIPEVRIEAFFRPRAQDERDDAVGEAGHVAQQGAVAVLRKQEDQRALRQVLPELRREVAEFAVGQGLAAVVDRGDTSALLLVKV